MPSTEDKSLASREALKSRITELYHKSIKENPSSLNAEHISKLKSFLYEKFPNKVLQLSQECTTIYSRDSLRAAAKQSGKGVNATVPEFTSATEVAKYREMFQREYRPHVAMENDTLLLPNGTVPSDAALGDIIRKLLAEVDQLLWDLQECMVTLSLLQPPFGEEKSFDSKILAAMIGSVDSIYTSTRNKRAELMGAFRGRASDIVVLNASPQMTDTRHYVAHSEEETLNDVATYATLLRNNYALVHQFVLKNTIRIEHILQQALKNAHYSKAGEA